MALSEANQIRGAPIQLEKLSKFFGKFAAVREANLDIKAGEFLTFLGPSGSGKTTTLMMVAGFLIPTQGDIRIAERSIVTVPPHKRNIGMMFQHYALFPHMSVADNIAFPLQMRKMRKSDIEKRVDQALELVRLSAFKHRRPHQLSGGQQQRVALARAVVFDPHVLLLDEPLGALDAKLRENMQIELKQLHSNLGTTILYVTHDQEEALTLSDRICVFNEGRIMQAGSPDALYNYPENRFVADFIGETNFLTGELIDSNDNEYQLQLDEDICVVGLNRDGFPNPKQWVTYSLRPEKILIGDAAGKVRNSYRGVVQEFLYLGEFTKYRIRLSSRIKLTIKATNRRGQQRWDKGDQVLVGWGRDEMLLVETDVPPEEEQ